MKLRTLLAVFGVALALTGFTLVAAPGLASTITLDEAVLVFVGLLGVLQGVRVAIARSRTAYEQVETPDPEASQDLPTPGDEFDEMLATAGADRREREMRESVRNRLERAAVATIVRTEGCTEAEAKRRLESGEWTDDPYARAFFTGSVEGASLFDRIDLRRDNQSRYHRWAVHAASEITRRSEGFDA
ncbi:DUF7269 family protein [Haloarchaeobius litoreus]|uniref:Uncharacterized protein n=1 Tax=Haloarchaeobius litoreus TaxID=755306 RepID=A0ABD6DIP7_9EURY|nr:hypothetical protein [Haloarchaeobius litoreus]